MSQMLLIKDAERLPQLATAHHAIQNRKQRLALEAGKKRAQRPQSYATVSSNGYIFPTLHDDANNNADPALFTMVDEPYPPCERSLDRLEPVFLSELVINSHHHGKVLLVRFERALGHEQQLTRTECSDVQASLSVEPPLQCKEAGNHAYKIGNFHEPLTWYTQGLQHYLDNPGLFSTASSAVKRDLYRNRAQAQLKLGQYDAAAYEALFSFSDETSDWIMGMKAYFLAAQAWYALKNYDAAADHGRKALNVQHQHKAAQRLLVKTAMRFFEQRTGTYDISFIESKIAHGNPRVDAAVFSSDTTVKAVESDNSHGLFATQGITFGSLVLAETAFASVWDNEEAYVTAMKWNARLPDIFKDEVVGLCKAASQKVRNNPRSGGVLLGLPGDHNVLGGIVEEVDGVPVVDAYQIHDIVARNTVHLRRTTGNGDMIHGSGIFKHSRIPNAKRTIYGDLLMIRAMKPIVAGEEISIDYGTEHENEMEALRPMRDD